MSDTVTAYRPSVGDRVHVDPEGLGVPPGVVGRTFVVAKVNPKNVKCSATDGGRGINFPAYLLVPGDAPAAPARAAVVGLPFVPREFFTLGEVVTLKRPMAGTPADLPYVVMKDDGRGKVNVAPLGGDRDRYVRVPTAGLVKRDLTWLAEHLVASL